MQEGPYSYPNGLNDLNAAISIDRFAFAMEVNKVQGELKGKAHSL